MTSRIATPRTPSSARTRPRGSEVRAGSTTGALYRTARAIPGEERDVRRPGRIASRMMGRFSELSDVELRVLQRALAHFQSEASPFPGFARNQDRDDKLLAGELYQETRPEQRDR